MVIKNLELAEDEILKIIRNIRKNKDYEQYKIPKTNMEANIMMHYIRYLKAMQEYNDYLIEIKSADKRIYSYKDCDTFSTVTRLF